MAYLNNEHIEVLREMVQGQLMNANAYDNEYEVEKYKDLLDALYRNEAYERAKSDIELVLAQRKRKIKLSEREMDSIAWQVQNYDQTKYHKFIKSLIVAETKK